MKKFESLSIKGQKMRIVKDAIAQTKSKLFSVEVGTYLHFLTDINFKSNDLKTALKDPKTTCEGCAKAGLFMACVLNVNKVRLTDDYSYEDFEKRKLKKWFSPLELDMIECAFEGYVVKDTAKKLEFKVRNEFGSESTGESNLAKKCIKFGNKYWDNTSRFIAILDNILKYGEFRPDGKTKISDYRSRPVS